MKREISNIIDWCIERYLQVQQIAGLLGIVNLFLLLNLNFPLKTNNFAVVFIFFSLIIAGWFVDTKLNFRRRSFRSHATNNPFWTETMERLKRIEKSCEDIHCQCIDIGKRKTSVNG